MLVKEFPGAKAPGNYNQGNYVLLILKVPGIKNPSARSWSNVMINSHLSLLPGEALEI